MTRGSHKSRSHCQKHEERSFLRFSSKFGSERAVDAVHVRHGRQVALLGHSLSRRLGAFLIPHPLQAESLPRVTLEKEGDLLEVLNTMSVFS